MPEKVMDSMAKCIIRSSDSIISIATNSLSNQLSQRFPQLKNEIKSIAGNVTKNLADVTEPIMSITNPYRRKKMLREEGLYIDPQRKFLTAIEKMSFGKELAIKRTPVNYFIIPLKQSIDLKLKNIALEDLTMPPDIQPEIICALFYL